LLLYLQCMCGEITLLVADVSNRLITQEPSRMIVLYLPVNEC